MILHIEFFITFDFIIITSDYEDSVRETALRTGRAIISSYLNEAITLLLPELIEGALDEDWHMRLAALNLCGDLLYTLSGQFFFKAWHPLPCMFQYIFKLSILDTIRLNCFCKIFFITVRFFIYLYELN